MTPEQRIQDLERRVQKIEKAIEPNGTLDIRLRENVDIKIQDILPGIKASIEFQLKPIRAELEVISSNTVISAKFAVSEQERREDREIAKRKAELDLEEQAENILTKRTENIGKRVDIQLKPAILLDSRIDGKHSRKRAIWALVISILGLISTSGAWAACSHIR